MANWGRIVLVVFGGAVVYSAVTKESVETKIENKVTIAREAVPGPAASTITLHLGDGRTEAQREIWWDENMAKRLFVYTGTVDDVEKGTFSGGTVELDIGSRVTVYCRLDDDEFKKAVLLNKGQNATCLGTTAGTYVKLFGHGFSLNDAFLR